MQAQLPSVSGTDGAVHCLLRGRDGVMFAGGCFQTAGGVPADRVARLEGGIWRPVGKGLGDAVLCLAQLPSGELVAGGLFTDSNGRPMQHIAKWDGSSWQPLGLGTDGAVESLTVTRSGMLIAGGQFQHAGGVPCAHVAAWNGANWCALGQGLNAKVTAIEELPCGDLLAGGHFHKSGGDDVPFLGRWDGATWSTFSDGVNGRVYALEQPTAGTLAVGGSFLLAGQIVSPHFSLFQGSRLARAKTLSVGCTSTVGTRPGLMTELPWAGGLWRSYAGPFPANSVVFAVYGLQPRSQSLPAIFGPMPSRCALLVADDFVVMTRKRGATASAVWRMPEAAAIQSWGCYHQMVSFEFNGSGHLLDVKATEAIQLTAGAL